VTLLSLLVPMRRGRPPLMQWSWTGETESLFIQSRGGWSRSTMCNHIFCNPIMNVWGHLLDTVQRILSTKICWCAWSAWWVVNQSRVAVSFLASFPGRRRNGLATSVSSNCIQTHHHGNCMISFKQWISGWCTWYLRFPAVRSVHIFLGRDCTIQVDWALPWNKARLTVRNEVLTNFLCWCSLLFSK